MQIEREAIQGGENRRQIILKPTLQCQRPSLHILTLLLHHYYISSLRQTPLLHSLHLCISISSPYLYNLSIDVTSHAKRCPLAESTHIVSWVAYPLVLFSCVYLFRLASFASERRYVEREIFREIWIDPQRSTLVERSKYPGLFSFFVSLCGSYKGFRWVEKAM